MKIGGEDIQRQYDHPDVHAGHFDEEMILPGADFADVPAVDDRGKGQHLAFGIAQKWEFFMAGEDRRVLQAFGMDLQNLTQAHAVGVSQRSELRFFGMDECIGDGECNGAQSVHADGDRPPFAAEDVGQFLLDLNELRQSFRRQLVPERLACGDERANSFQSLLHDDMIARATGGL